MAFISLLFVYLAIIIGIIIICTVIGSIFLIIAMVIKRKQKKKAIEENIYHKKFRYSKGVYILTGIGIVFMLPLVGSILLILYGIVSSVINQYTGLGYNVTHGNYERAEKILKRGVDPDCTVDSNEKAAPGEPTLLWYLCMGEDDMYSELTIEERQELMELLLEYGADIEWRKYRHEKEYKDHYYDETDESSYYMGSDECGYTPLHWAVRRGDEEMLKFLAEHGADVNTEDYCGFNTIATVADELSDEQGYDIFTYLVSQGVEVCDETNFKQQTMFLAGRNTENEMIRSAIYRKYGIFYDVR